MLFLVSLVYFFVFFVVKETHHKEHEEEYKGHKIEKRDFFLSGL